jgi:ribosome modulation factor
MDHDENKKRRKSGNNRPSARCINEEIGGRSREFCSFDRFESRSLHHPIENFTDGAPEI